jgi:DNA-directed RNA polymerase specialized sigma24 family protein
VADEIDKALKVYQRAEGRAKARALDRLLALLRPEMIKAIRARGLVQEGDLEDVVQEAMIVLYRNGLSQYRGEGPFLNYAMHIAGRGSWVRDAPNGLLPDENLVLMDPTPHRSSGGGTGGRETLLERPHEDDACNAPDAWALGKDLARHAQGALSTLAKRSPDQARAVGMASKGATIKRIAFTLGVSVGNARLLLHRGRSEMRRMLKEGDVE